MKNLRETLDEINGILETGKVAHLVDSKTNTFLSFRLRKNRTLSFKRLYDFEIDRHMDEFLELPIVSVTDYGNYINFFTEGLSQLLRKYDIIY